MGMASGSCPEPHPFFMCQDPSIWQVSDLPVGHTSPGIIQMICSSRLREWEAPSLANGPSVGQRGLASGCFYKPGARATDEKGLPDERVYNLCGYGCACKVDHVQGTRRHDRGEIRQDVRRLPVGRSHLQLDERASPARVLRLRIMLSTT